jgi:hypothetical protein
MGSDIQRPVLKGDYRCEISRFSCTEHCTPQPIAVTDGGQCQDEDMSIGRATRSRAGVAKIKKCFLYQYLEYPQGRHASMVVAMSRCKQPNLYDQM